MVLPEGRFMYMPLKVGFLKCMFILESFVRNSVDVFATSCDKALIAQLYWLRYDIIQSDSFRSHGQIEIQQCVMSRYQRVWVWNAPMYSQTHQLHIRMQPDVIPDQLDWFERNQPWAEEAIYSGGLCICQVKSSHISSPPLNVSNH